MSAGRNILLLVFILALPLCALAQKKTKAQLQREKQQSLEKIKEVEKIIEETSTKKKTSIGQLNALNHQISEQEKK